MDAKTLADFWTELSRGGVLVYERPQVGQECLHYRDQSGQRGTFPNMIRGVFALDPEGTRFEITFFDLPSVVIKATLADKSKRLRRVTAPPTPASDVEKNLFGADYPSHP